MNPDYYIFVDVQGFKDSQNTFIIKELALVTSEYTQTFVIKPPYPFSSLTPEEKRQVLWIERNRNIYWSEGFIDYREFKRVIIPYLDNQKILTKGLEKTKWIKELCSTCEVIDVGEKGWPCFKDLYIKYCKDHNRYNCIVHKKYCALKNAICIKKWYYDNNMFLFSL